jgi:acetylornithine/N-succinyldiaminopimelate aminotransferase
VTPRQIFLHHQAQTSLSPILLEVSHASGIFIYDTSGKKYVDFISGIGVSAVGHCHPRVVKAVQEQASIYMHQMVYGEYVQTPQTSLAAKLATLLPENLSCCYFVNSGAEATEGAIKLSKRFTGRSEIISFKNAYHGSTNGALSLMGDEHFKKAYEPLLPGVKFIPFNDMNSLKEISEKTAAVFVETIQGEAGVILPENGFLKALQDKCNAMGAMLVMDEIQCGVGRTGKWFAFEHYDIVPDILLLAKGLGGGMPIGAFISSEKIMHSLAENPALGHITTFGGHPVNCAAALACLEVIEDDKLLGDIAEKESIIIEMLVHPMIKSISGKGLLWAAEFESFEINKRIIDTCLKNGVIIDWFLFAPEKMRIAPPLTITKSELKEALETIIRSIS